MGYVTASARVDTSQDSRICISGVYLSAQRLRKRARTVPPIICVCSKLVGV